MRGDGGAGAEDGEEEEREPGGGEEFGVGGALVGGEEHVGVGEVEGGGEEGGVGRGEVRGRGGSMARPAAVRASAGEERSGGESARARRRVRRAPSSPGEGRVEDEAGLAGVPGGGDGPVGVEVAVAELAGGFEPVEEVEVEVVAAGAAVEDEGRMARRRRGDEELRHGGRDGARAGMGL